MPMETKEVEVSTKKCLPQNIQNNHRADAPNVPPAFHSAPSLPAVIVKWKE